MAPTSDAQQAVAIAQAILDGATPMLLGCKQLAEHLARLGVHHEEPFVAIAAVDSESDDLPIWPQERAAWNPQQLAEADEELNRWRHDIEPSVHNACRHVLARFG